MNHQERYAYVRVLQKQYRKASRKQKMAILDELVRNTGYHQRVCQLVASV